MRDLDAAAALYRRLGFTVGARNRHSWGTHNHIIQLPGFFVELLTVAEPEQLGTDGFSALFGTFNRRFLNDQEGLSLLILESGDAAADAAAFRAAGIGVSDALSFEREGKRPDGSTVKVGFSLAFARDPKAPSIGFAACQQHFPENFWNPAFQQHANTASAVGGRGAGRPTIRATITASCRPSAGCASCTRHAERHQRIDAARRHRGHGLRQHSAIASAPSRRMFPRVRGLPRCDFACATAPRWRHALTAGGIASSHAMGSTVVAPETAMGATLVFE